MKLSTTFVAALVASLATASPTRCQIQIIDGDNTPHIESNTPLIDLWQDPDFLGLKFTGSSTPGTCKNLGGTGFRNRVRSGKAKPNFRCTIWVEPNCLGTGFSFNADPGVASLPPWIDNKAQSWKCVDA